jgi:hypothetical protein
MKRMKNADWQEESSIVHTLIHSIEGRISTLFVTISVYPFHTGQTFHWKTLPAVGFLRRSSLINFSRVVALQPSGAFYRVELYDRLVNLTSNLAV